MTVTNCDICGKTICKTDVPRPHFAGEASARPGLFGVLLEKFDCCPKCMELGADVHWEAMMLTIWREEYMEKGDWNKNG